MLLTITVNYTISTPAERNPYIQEIRYTFSPEGHIEPMVTIIRAGGEILEIPPILVNGLLLSLEMAKTCNKEKKDV